MTVMKLPRNKSLCFTAITIVCIVGILQISSVRAGAGSSARRGAPSADKGSLHAAPVEVDVPGLPRVVEVPRTHGPLYGIALDTLSSRLQSLQYQSGRATSYEQSPRRLTQLTSTLRMQMAAQPGKQQFIPLTLGNGFKIYAMPLKNTQRAQYPSSKVGEIATGPHQKAAILGVYPPQPGLTGRGANDRTIRLFGIAKVHDAWDLHRVLPAQAEGSQLAHNIHQVLHF